MTKTALTPTLEIAYEEAVGLGGRDVVLLHGFPYDVRSFDTVVGLLADAGHRVIVPYLRGFGPTRFLDPNTPRSGEQAALALDLLELVDTLGLVQPVLAGFDWGGRTAIAASALWPERFGGVLSTGGYSLYNVAAASVPFAPEIERMLWYQHYLCTERGRTGFACYRKEFCRLLWHSWSPNWNFDDATFEATACSFDNPDFVDVVVHSYRHRNGAAEGAPAYAELEANLANLPAITIPSVILRSGQAPMSLPERGQFTHLLSSTIVDQAGHNLPQECPAEFARSLSLLLT